jgi:hypothetical protein
LFTDRSRVLYPAEIAVVEDVAGGSLEALLERDPVAAERPLSVLGDWLAAMAAVRSPSYGKVAFVDAGGRTAGTSCERVMLDRALAQLAEIAVRERRAAGAQGRLKETLHSLAEPIEPRAASALIHGELGPDHVLLEGAMYFDVEVEHAWMRMRFGGHYAKLSQGGLDEDRQTGEGAPDPGREDQRPARSRTVSLSGWPGCRRGVSGRGRLSGRGRAAWFPGRAGRCRR